MDELIGEIEKIVKSIDSNIERSKRMIDTPIMNDNSQYYRLMSLSISLEKWESVLNMIMKYRNSRCIPIEKKSEHFSKIIEVQIKGVPGFITRPTIYSMIEYIKQLEWKIDSLNGIWKERLTEN
ncbi:hypothetical protein BVG16_07640 [Paenibacillus selenitireducens]|uniref:Uncharacterized protein n=1 Tax=Paenibacillus selenitireducens TaxID=1324314 RepID=A0A1T2XL39_9BACL|nr:hypothetical protein [Paenibacillus selenitireducens]OPA80584.1 hypothetical protein BVG16_07640 [Paenibacillus selenitireducens]